MNESTPPRGTDVALRGGLKMVLQHFFVEMINGKTARVLCGQFVPLHDTHFSKDRVNCPQCLEKLKKPVREVLCALDQDTEAKRR